jgi:myosin heavy subunit
LREETASLQVRLDRTADALEVARSDAAKARTEAETAQVVSATLAQNLQGMEAAVKENRQMYQTIQHEHQKISQLTQTMQDQLVRKELQLLRVTSDSEKVRLQLQQQEKRKSSWQKERNEMFAQLQAAREELDEVKRTLQERDSWSAARQARAHHTQQEWQHAQTLLAQATEVNAQKDETHRTMQDLVTSLEQANKQLHEQLQSYQTQMMKENERLQGSLGTSEAESQQLKLALESCTEQRDRYQYEASQNADRIATLSQRVASLERQASSDTSAGPFGRDLRSDERQARPDILERLDLHPSSTLSGMSKITSARAEKAPGAPSDLVNDTPSALKSGGASGSSERRFAVPPLRDSLKKIKVPPLPSTAASSTPTPAAGKHNCVLCQEPLVTGIVRECQCDGAGCRARAHNTCVQKRLRGSGMGSVSYPGTPALASSKPLVLCRASSK